MTHPSYVEAKKFAAFPKLIPREQALVGVQRTKASVLTHSGIKTSEVKISRFRSASIPSASVAKEIKGSTSFSISFMYSFHFVFLKSSGSFPFNAIVNTHGTSFFTASDPFVLVSNLFRKGERHHDNGHVYSPFKLDFK